MSLKLWVAVSTGIKRQDRIARVHVLHILSHASGAIIESDVVSFFLLPYVGARAAQVQGELQWNVGIGGNFCYNFINLQDSKKEF